MLRIGAVRWRGKCSKHPSFDPTDGMPATAATCERCGMLRDIWEHHRKMMDLMKRFTPPKERKRPPSDADRQISLFDGF